MKVIASDFDGTLYFGSDIKIKDEDVRKIKEFQTVGNMFGICTGRSVDGLLYFNEERIKYDFYIVSGGGLILDKNLNELYKNCIEYSSLKRLYERYESEYTIYIHANRLLYTLKKAKYQVIQKEIKSLDILEDMDIYSVSIPTPGEGQAEALAQEINETFSDLSAVHNTHFVDVLKKGTSKGTAINVLKSLYGIDIIAGIGDSYNDLPMFEVVNKSFSFEYAPEGVKKQVDIVVSTVSEAIDIVTKSNM